MKVKDLIGRYGEMELTEEQLKALGIEAEVDRFKRCEVEERYYFIAQSYGVCHTHEADCTVDDIYHEIGNYYPCKHWSEEEVRAIAARKKKKAIAKNKVNRRIRELNDGWVPNWEDESEAKWCICYKRDTATFTAEYTIVTDYNASICYCKSREITGQIIKEMHEELKVIWEVE